MGDYLLVLKSVVIRTSRGTDCRKWEEHHQEQPGHIQNVHTFSRYLLLTAKKMINQASSPTQCSCFYTKSIH